MVLSSRRLCVVQHVSDRITLDGLRLREASQAYRTVQFGTRVGGRLHAPSHGSAPGLL